MGTITLPQAFFLQKYLTRLASGSNTTYGSHIAPESKDATQDKIEKPYGISLFLPSFLPSFSSLLSSFFPFFLYLSSYR